MLNHSIDPYLFNNHLCTSRAVFVDQLNDSDFDILRNMAAFKKLQQQKASDKPKHAAHVDAFHVTFTFCF